MDSLTNSKKSGASNFTSISLPELAKESRGPIPDPKKRHYIVGYGSLMDTSSKSRAYKNTGENIPVEIQGYRREWNLRGDILLWPGSTFLGVVPDPQAHFNAAVFQIPPTDDVGAILHQYDSWELLYNRQEVNVQNIRILGGNSGGQIKVDADQETFWIYVNKMEYTQLPTKEYPIVQSYVDVFLCGCLEIEEKFELKGFTETAVKTTGGWSLNHWINDRIFPRRPFIHQPKAWKIDTILKSQVPQAYANMKVEELGLNI